MNFVELMEFLNAYSAIDTQKSGVKPKTQILANYKNGYCVCFNERHCSPRHLLSLERMVALRGLNLEKRDAYWVVWSPGEH